ncbi:MAG TPA: ABC transporter permease [Casimicrobiaceae bacterium]|jgi:ABC-type polysaccharide/polyol phosphate export permease
MTDTTAPVADPPARDPHAARARDRALFANFFHRELFTRYLGSVTGLAWALVSPIALLAVYHFVFTAIFPARGFGQASFLAFLAVALWPWFATQEAIQRGTTSLAGYAGLIRKVAFPHELVVYASVAATFTLQFAGYVAILVILFAMGEPLHLAGLAIVAPLWAVLMLGVVGIVLALAALQVFVRDVEHVLNPVLMMFMYLTPILYPITAVPASVRPWLAANPFGWLVGRMRNALLDGRLAFEPADAVALVVAFVLFAAGRFVFRRLSPHFEDFV